MKVKCIVDMDFVDGPYLGEVYEVLSIEPPPGTNDHFYRIANADEESYLYPAECFEIVEPLPAATVITEYPPRTAEEDAWIKEQMEIIYKNNPHLRPA